MAHKRILRQLNDFNKQKPSNLLVFAADDDPFHWQVTLYGPPETPYEGGIFLLDVRFPKDYPFKPPKIRFLTKIFHPNVHHTGQLSLGVLCQDWSPALTIVKVLCIISQILEKPDPDNPFDTEIAQVCKTDKTKFEAIAKQWVKKYAK